MYAVKVLTAAYNNEEIPPLPSAPDSSYICNAADYVGTYRTGNKVLQLMAEEGKLLLDYEGEVISLEQRTQNSFYIGHPHLDMFLLEFKRDYGNVVEAFHGSNWYINKRYAGPQYFQYPEAWEAYPGHYRVYNPELSNFRVVLRKDTLSIIYPSGAVDPLRPLEDGSFRIGDDHRSPETLKFDTIVESCALRAIYSGCPYYRTFTL
jgi:hypothetical protein